MPVVLPVINVAANDFSEQVFDALANKHCFILTGFDDEFTDKQQQLFQEFQIFLQDKPAQQKLQPKEGKIAGFYPDGSNALGSTSGDLLFFQHEVDGSQVRAADYLDKMNKLEVALFSTFTPLFDKIMAAVAAPSTPIVRMMKLHQARPLPVTAKDVILFKKHRDIGLVSFLCYRHNNSNGLQIKINGQYETINVANSVPDKPAVLVITGEALQQVAAIKHRVIQQPGDPRTLMTFFYLSEDYQKRVVRKEEQVQQKEIRQQQYVRPT